MLILIIQVKITRIITRLCIFAQIFTNDRYGFV
jgi:hypothetical protein